MGIDFYYMALSSPCRAVHMAAKEYNIPLNLINVDLRKGEHLKPNFLKINPLHLIPTIDDDGLYLWESAAIMTYFANKYGGPDDKLYPKDASRRAVVDKVLHFYTGSLYSSYFSFYFPQIFLREKPNAEKQQKLYTALNGIETFLIGKAYVAADHRTLADLAVLATVASIENFGVDLSPWPKMQNWLKRLKTELSCYNECNEKGLKEYKAWFLGEDF